MASPLFFEGLRTQFGLELLLDVHLAQSAFSASSSFIRDIIGTSMPPYLARHL
jgi:hypothetical protein